MADAGTERPFVYVNMAMTVDGKITSSAREYPAFTSKRDRSNMDRLRAEADALIVGAGTMRADNPALHVRSPEMQRYRKSLGKGGLSKVLVTASGRIDDSSRFFDETDGGDRIVATSESADPDRLARIGRRALVWKLGRQRVDLALLLSRLGSGGAERVLVEGGGELNWQMFELDLVDELYVTIAPVLLGGREAPTLLEGAGWPVSLRRRVRLVTVEQHDDELFCRYALER